MLQYFSVFTIFLTEMFKIFLQNKIEAITNTLVFDGMGQRTDVIFQILELTPAGNESVSSVFPSLYTILTTKIIN